MEKENASLRREIELQKELLTVAERLMRRPDVDWQAFGEDMEKLKRIIRTRNS